MARPLSFEVFPHGRTGTTYRLVIIIHIRKRKPAFEIYTFPSFWHWINDVPKHRLSIICRVSFGIIDYG